MAFTDQYTSREEQLKAERATAAVLARYSGPINPTMLDAQKRPAIFDKICSRMEEIAFAPRDQILITVYSSQARKRCWRDGKVPKQNLKQVPFINRPACLRIHGPRLRYLALMGHMAVGSWSSLLDMIETLGLRDTCVIEIIYSVTPHNVATHRNVWFGSRYEGVHDVPSSKRHFSVAEIKAWKPTTVNVKIDDGGLDAALDEARKLMPQVSLTWSELSSGKDKDELVDIKGEIKIEEDYNRILQETQIITV